MKLNTTFIDDYLQQHLDDSIAELITLCARLNLAGIRSKRKEKK